MPVERSIWQGALAAFLALCFALDGCAPSAPNIASGVVVVPGGAPLTAEHSLSPGDEFEIRFPFEPEFNERITIGQDGRVSLKLVGETVLGGLTLPEATALLKRRYAKRVKNPELSLTIRRYAPEVVYVDGWVNRVGIVRSDLPLTLARALTQAGGMKTGATSDDILIMRRDSEGNVHATTAALGNFAGAGRPGQDPLLKSFDVVYVPRSAITTIAGFVADYTRNVPFSGRFETAPLRAPPPPPNVVRTLVPPAVSTAVAPP